MTGAPDDWSRVRPLLARLFDLPDHGQDALLAEVARTEPDLAARVGELLQSERSDPGFLQPAGSPLHAEPPLAPLAAGDLLGAWRLLRPLGAGGMGEVWLAERADGEFALQVAVKLLRGALVSETQRERFAQERALLATLEHPSIARLLDGGSTADGRPWLAMEYVDGLPIDQAADAAALSVGERLALFCRVCEAVAAAHAALVVHRDLKPDNVLVGADGRPVLLDFGVAKVLAVGVDPASALTVTGGRAFTPSYASPEQLLGRPVSTRADVYSLGVLLYELLAGRRPHDLTGASPTEVLERLTETTPPAPSQVAPAERRRALQGDLDTIVGRAMHADPDRRYDSARALADDVRRHLDGLPVLARPDELGYRLGRFVRRHAVTVSAAAALLLVLVVSLITITSLLWETETARGQAQAGWEAADARAESLRDLAHALVFDVYDAVEHLQGASAARSALLALAVDSLDELAGRERSASGAAVDLAYAYLRLGDLQGRPGAASALDLQSAATSYRRVGELLAGLPGSLDPRTAVLRADALGKLAAVELRSGQRDHAAAALEQAGADLAPAGDATAHAALALRQAEYWQASGRSDEALAACERAQRALEASDRMDLGILRLHQLLASRRGQVLRARGELPAAEAALGRAVQLSEALAFAFPDDGQARRDLGLALGEWGSLLIERGEVEGAREPMQRQLALFEGLHDAGADDVLAVADLALACEKHAEWQAARGDLQGAFDDRRRALALDGEVVARGAGGQAARSRLGHDEMLVSDAELAIGQPAAALASALRAIDVLAPLHSADGDDVATSRDLLVAHLRVGEVLLADERLPEALAAFERGHELARALVGTDPSHGPTRRLEMVAGYFRAVCHQAFGRQTDRDPAARAEQLARAATFFGDTQRASALLAAGGQLQPGDEAMEPVLEAERRACETERAAVLAAGAR